MTTSEQIQKYLIYENDFLGCYPCDSLPPFPKQLPKTLIVNTDNSSESGSHWVGLVLMKHYCFYFDSYGVGILEANILNYIREHYLSYIYSVKEIQAIRSEKCGQFCISFVMCVRSIRDYNIFLNKFDGDKDNLSQNDVVINRMMKKKIFRKQIRGYLRRK